MERRLESFRFSFGFPAFSDWESRKIMGDGVESGKIWVLWPTAREPF